MATGSQYRRIKRLAMGGMAEVWLAHQQGLGGFERLVVVKRILPHLESNPQLVEMFLREATTAASLSHPHLVDVIGVHREEQSVQIVMEYLLGVNLRELQVELHRTGAQLPPTIAMRIAADVADGLHYAHTLRHPTNGSKGILHKDITPSNIMVTFNGVAKVLDFGLVGSGGPAGADIDGSHGYGAHLSYASPEQLHHEPLGPSSDIFSLGVVLHELLTGRRLFAADSNAGLVQAVLERAVPPPSSINPEVPPAFDEVVLHALRRDVSRRTARASDFRDAIHSCLFEASTVVSQARLSRWLQTSLPEVYRDQSAEERRAIREARASVDPFRSSSTLAVSSSDFDAEDSAATRISIMDTTADSPSELSAENGRALQEPIVEPTRGMWVYAASASVATLAVLVILVAAYVVGRNAG